MAVIPPISDVQQPCVFVSENPEVADVENGFCVTAAVTFVSALVGEPDIDANQALADAVAAIAGLSLNDPICDEIDDEIAVAVRVLSQRSTDAQQQLQLLEIAATIEACEQGVVGAIAAPGPVGTDTVGQASLFQEIISTDDL